MAVRYYDDAIVAKLNKWLPTNKKLRVLKPDETARLFAHQAYDSKDKPLELPVFALSRNPDIELLSNIKNNKSFEGIKVISDPDKTVHFNAIPIKVEYQFDIFTKKVEDGDEYVRNFLFKLINNPAIYIEIPYNGAKLQHIANLRVLPNISDTSNISERLFEGQFTRWTIQIELQDAFLFSIPYRANWKISGVDFEVSEQINEDGEIEESFETNGN